MGKIFILKASAVVVCLFILAPNYAGNLTATPDEFLLIPNIADDVVSMYDSFDGTYLGDLITVPILYGAVSSPVNAILGPDDYIYVSDLTQDAVFRFNPDGSFFDVYADSSDGLNKVRGIDFRDGHLFVTSGDKYVAEFDGPHSRLADFIDDGSDPADIYFLPDGRALLSDIKLASINMFSSSDLFSANSKAAPGYVRLYNADGTMDIDLFSITVPLQIQGDTDMPGEYLNASFVSNLITDFDPDGTVQDQLIFDSGRGVYRLGNGNLLVTAPDGVWEVDAVTGVPTEQESIRSAGFIELMVREIETIYLDIKPGSCPNSFNPKSQGKLPVALLGTMEFDIYMVDVETLELARADGVGGSVTPNVKPNGSLHMSYEDAGTPFDGDLCDCHEMEGDGYMDLGIKFLRPEMTDAFMLSEMMPGHELELVLSGTLLDGTTFEAHDCIRIVGGGNPLGN